MFVLHWPLTIHRHNWWRSLNPHFEKQCDCGAVTGWKR